MRVLPDHIDGDGISLRRYVANDAEAMHDAVTANIEHLRPWMGWISLEPLTVEDRRELIAGWERGWRAGGDVLTGIWQAGRLVGSCGLHRRIGPDGLEIGYWVGADHVGRGIASTAAALLTDLAFTVPEIEGVEIHHDVANVRSRRVPEKLGFEWICQVPADRDLKGTAETGTDDVWRVSRERWADLRAR
jgi:RimJ/RimL family protein N-acetyltransferase